MKVASTTSMGRVRRSLLVAAMLSASLLTIPLASGSAKASFPGANGWIAFTTDRDTSAGQLVNDEIYVIDEQGQTRRLTNHPALDQLPAVSPNGKEIAFTSRRDDPDNPNSDGNSEIYVMDVSDDDGNGNGDNLRRISNSPESTSNPTWSPDGRTIAFAATSGGATIALDIYVMDADGSEPTIRLTDSPGADAQPVFSPDGNQIAFLSVRNGNTDIWLMNADGTNQTRLTSHPAVDSQPEFSPDGSRLAFASARDGTFDIYLMRAEPESATNVAVNLTNSTAPANARWPAWASDGTKIAYWSGVNTGLGDDADIYMINVDGSNATKLTTDGHGDAWPELGPGPTKPQTNQWLRKRAR